VFRQSRTYDSIHGLAVSPDGRTVVATGGAYDGFPVGATDSHVVTAAFDAATGSVRWSAVWDGRPDATDNGNDVAFSPDGSDGGWLRLDATRTSRELDGLPSMLRAEQARSQSTGGGPGSPPRRVALPALCDKRARGSAGSTDLAAA